MRSSPLLLRQIGKWAAICPLGLADGPIVSSIMHLAICK